MHESFIKYNSMNMGNVQLCYATGKELPSTYKHPSKIRNSGDKAKFISSNDESGFTYRGRFSGKEEAISVSYEFSQKFHNALKWLIERQGLNIDNSAEWISRDKDDKKRSDEKESKRNDYKFDSLILVVWASGRNFIPNPTNNEFDNFLMNLNSIIQLRYNMIIDKMSAEDFTSTKRLEPLYLLGYHNFMAIKSEKDKTEE